MTEPTIQLQKGLEAWYEFDTRSFDSQRNSIADKSGYGRHAGASGGPTVGVNGPDGFEATSFDGSDDQFKVSSATFPTEDVVTVTALFKSDGNWSSPSNRGAVNLGNPKNLSGNSGSTGATLAVNYEGTVIFVGEDDFKITAPHDMNNFIWVSGIADSTTDELFIWVDGKLITYDDSQTFSSMRLGNRSFGIGDIPSFSDNRTLSGEIALAIVNSRRLSTAEIKHVHSLTGPRRANL
jgi:hypothetical protein